MLEYKNKYVLEVAIQTHTTHTTVRLHVLSRALTSLVSTHGMKPSDELAAANDAVDLALLPTYTRNQLARFNGADGSDVYVGIRGVVYDVTPNRQSYGPGKSYHSFVGKDLTRLLGLNKINLNNKDPPKHDATGFSLDREHCTWYTGDFGDKEHAAVDKWTQFFNKRYHIVATIVDHEL